MSDIGARLRAERERIGLVQAELAERCGVKKNAQSNYERGERVPDADFLARASELGLDVLYVITGQRAVGSVSADEAALLEAYRAAPEVVRRAAVAGLRSGASTGPEVKIEGDVGAVVRGDATFSGDFNFGGKKK